MIEMQLEHWQLPAQLQLALDIALRKPVQIPADTDWSAFDASVRQHRIQPLLIRGLRNLDRETLEQHSALNNYRGMQNKYTMDSLNRMKALAQIGRVFSDAGIPMISMKGPLLAMELYGDPSLRTSRDLDVLVPQANLAQAGELLRSLGYTMEENPFHRTPLRKKYLNLIELEKHEVYQKGEICVELHWKDNFQAEQSFDTLWASREEQMLLGQRIAVMGAADRYPALIIHAAEHGFLRLRWLLDLYELQKKSNFSWEKTYTQMCSQGVGELLIETLMVMYRLDLPGLADVSWDGFSLARKDGGIRLRLSDAMAEHARKARSLCDAVYPLLLREVLRTEQDWKDYDRLLPTCMVHKTFLQTVLLICGPSLHELELIDLPDALFWLYFLIRPFHWLWRKLTGHTSH